MSIYDNFQGWTKGVPRGKLSFIMENKLKCPQCGNEKGQQRHGKTRSGTQRYYCGQCKKAYSLQPSKHTYTEEERTLAIKIYYENSSGRAVGRILGMSKANAARWIKERAAKISEPDKKATENTNEPIDRQGEASAVNQGEYTNRYSLGIPLD